MSTFTQFNGPQPVGPSTKDITDLINAYTEVKSKLEALTTSLSSHVNASDAHDTEINSKISQATSSINTAITSLNNDIATLKGTSTKEGSVLNTVGTAIQAYDTTIQATISSIQGSIASINEALSSISVTANSAATKTALDALTSQVSTLQSNIASLESIAATVTGSTFDFAKMDKFKAQYAGTGTEEDTGTNGIYILGMLSNKNIEDVTSELGKFKPATVYLKFVNDNPLDAVLHIAATSSNTGSISANIARKSDTWKDLTFLLAYGTSSSGKQGIWLGISCADISELADTAFYVSGINFITPTGEEYFAPNKQVGGTFGIVHFKDNASFAATDLKLTTDSLDMLTAEEAHAIWEKIKAGED